ILRLQCWTDRSVGQIVEVECPANGVGKSSSPRCWRSPGMVPTLIATTSNEFSFARRGNETGVFAPSSSLDADHGVTLSSVVLSGRNHASRFDSSLSYGFLGAAPDHDARSGSSAGKG